MSSIVEVPQNTDMDYDYIAFSFDGKHSYEDFGIYRISDSKEGYNESLTSVMIDKTVDVPGSDGQFYFGTQHKNRVFNIKFAFDSLPEEKLQLMKKWLNGKNVGDLWFAEAPHKVYTAKVTGSATISALAFSPGDGKRIYKGTGTVQFTCFYPYAHTPDIIRVKKRRRDELVVTDLFGGCHTSYEAFGPRLYEEIKQTLPLATDGNGNATESSFGDLPFNFVAKLFIGDGTLETKTDIVGTEYVVSNGYYNETTQCYYIGKQEEE